MVNLAFVVDGSEAYVKFERDRILKEWGIQWDETRTITKIDEAGSASLFGDPPVSILTIETKEEIRPIVERLKEASKSDLSKWTNPGILLLTSVARTSTKTLEKLISDLGGQVSLSKSAPKESPSAKLVEELSVPRDVKNFLKDYAGDDYSSILSLISSLSSLTPRQQQGISIEDLLVRMPQQPGAIPPWEIEPAIMNGNLTKAIETYRRVSKTSHLLVVMAILKKKFDLCFKVASILQNNPSASKEKIASDLGVKNDYPLQLSISLAKRIGFAKSLQIVEIAAETEAKVKGGSSGSSEVLMEVMIARITHLAKG